MQKGSLKQKDTNPFKYSDDNKRYHTWNYHLRHKFNSKVFKVPLDGGFTCPNIDGSKGTGGCIYCSGRGSGDFAGNRSLPVAQQFESVKQMLHKKWQQALYIPYFQAYTNTYAPLDELRQKYESVLNKPGVVGISIATRADCINEEIADYLLELSKRIYLIVELGLQSVHDITAVRINRCHTYEEFLKGYALLKSRGINVCVHIINGLPGETGEMMLKTAEELAKLDIHSIKIHMLHIIRGTKASEEYQKGLFTLLDMDEYTDIVCAQLQLLPPETIIQRVTGDGAPADLIAPEWTLKKFVVMNQIDKKMFDRNLWQGRLWKK